MKHTHTHIHDDNYCMPLAGSAHRGIIITYNYITVNSLAREEIEKEELTVYS